MFPVSYKEEEKEKKKKESGFASYLTRGKYIIKAHNAVGTPIKFEKTLTCVLVALTERTRC